MPSQVLNFLWLNLELPAPQDPAGGGIFEPMRASYIENIRKAALAHPQAEIDLWVDSKRLTEKQMAYLKALIENGATNAHLKDLRDIPAYNEDALYNKGETDPEWRGGGQHSLIWRQVDAAKILVSLQGNYEQTFFADLDHAHLDIDSPQVQNMLKKHDVLIGSSNDQSPRIENQLWGFTPKRRKFFEEYYETALQAADNGMNAWNELVRKADRELIKKQWFIPSRKKAPLKEICLLIVAQGGRATQPGSCMGDGYGRRSEASVITAVDLARIFNTSSVKSTPEAPSATEAGFISDQPLRPKGGDQCPHRF
jgi:hypothetical protein